MSNLTDLNLITGAVDAPQGETLQPTQGNDAPTVDAPTSTTTSESALTFEAFVATLPPELQEARRSTDAHEAYKRYLRNLNLASLVETRRTDLEALLERVESQLKPLGLTLLELHDIQLHLRHGCPLFRPTRATYMLPPSYRKTEDEEVTR